MVGRVGGEFDTLDIMMDEAGELSCKRLVPCARKLVSSVQSWTCKTICNYLNFNDHKCSKMRLFLGLS